MTRKRASVLAGVAVLAAAGFLVGGASLDAGQFAAIVLAGA